MWRNTTSDVGWRGCTAPQWSRFSIWLKNVISLFVKQLASSFICAFWPQFVRNPIIHGCSLKEFNSRELWKYQANIEVGNGKGRALIWGKRVMVGKDSTLLQPTPIARLDQIIWRQEWHLRRLGFYYAAFEMSNLLIARTFYPFQKCCADAIFVPHYFEISIFHMKRPKIKT